jgi:3-methyladenine DNA glycosylase Mpg
VLQLDKSFYGEPRIESEKIWVEDIGVRLPSITTPRIGITYAGEPLVSKLWRFLCDPEKVEKDPTDTDAE